jgi:hypothetical protein
MRHKALFAAAVLCLVAPPARAGVIFNNFGPGDTYLFPGVFWTVGTSDDYEPSAGFTVAAGTDYTLSEIDFSAGVLFGTAAVGVGLREDAGGMPGAILESWTVSGLGSSFALRPPEVATSALHPTLLAGRQYWVTLTGGDETTQAGWDANAIFDQGPVYLAVGGTPILTGTDTRPAFRVLGEPAAVPEPSSLVGAAVAASVGLLLVRRHRRAIASAWAAAASRGAAVAQR